MEKDKWKDMTTAELNVYHDIKVMRYVELEKERLSICEKLNDVEMELGKRLLVGRIKDDIVKDGISGYIKIKEVKSVSRVYDGLAYDVTADIFAEANTNRTCCDRQLFGYEYEPLFPASRGNDMQRFIIQITGIS